VILSTVNEIQELLFDAVLVNALVGHGLCRGGADRPGGDVLLGRRMADHEVRRGVVARVGFTLQDFTVARLRKRPGQPVVVVVLEDDLQAGDVVDEQLPDLADFAA